MTGTSQTMKDATVTGDFKFMDTLLWRVEYRRDLSDAPVCAKSTDATVDSQSTFGMGFLYS